MQYRCKRLWLCAVYHCLLEILPAQTPSLKRGEALPDLVLHQVLNVPGQKVRLSDYKGKVLLLDFWSTGCAGCVSAWPKLLKLQEQYADKLQIILINPWESMDKVQKLFAFQKKIAQIEMHLPAVCGDTILKKWLDFASVPDYVWFDTSGRLQAFTNSGSVKGSNVESIWSGEKTEMVNLIFNDSILWIDKRNSPVFVQGNGGNLQKLYWQTTFAKGEDRLASSYLSGASPWLGYHIAVNLCIRDHYRFAYSTRTRPPGGGEQSGELDLLQLNRIDFRVRDTLPYVNYLDGEYLYNSQYVYQLIAPETTMEQLQTRMQQDLRDVIGLEAHWEKRMKNCLVFTCRDTTRIAYREGSFRANVSETGLQVNNVSMPFLIFRLEEWLSNFYFSPYPLLDETGLRGNLGALNIEANMHDYAQLNKALSAHGLQLTLQERPVNILVITEPPGYIPFWQKKTYQGK